MVLVQSSSKLLLQSLVVSVFWQTWRNLTKRIHSVLCSLPRTLQHVSLLSIISAIAMFIAIVLSLIYAGIEDAPLGAIEPVRTSIGLPDGGPGFVDGLNAVLK